ncbi:MAG: hypothetical protein WDM81_03770 [Rhizomicrobium sp.]
MPLHPGAERQGRPRRRAARRRREFLLGPRSRHAGRARIPQESRRRAGTIEAYDEFKKYNLDIHLRWRNFPKPTVAMVEASASMPAG